MNQKVLRTLEYNKIVERLAEYAFGEDTKERCLSLLPSTSLSEITNAQQQTKDAMNRSLKRDGLTAPVSNRFLPPSGVWKSAEP